MLNIIEEEVVFLKAANDGIASMVNCEMLTVHNDPSGSTILFASAEHQRSFNILLADFLSRTDRRAPVRRKSFLGALRHISTQPQFNATDSVGALRNATTAFVQWLEHSPVIEVWLPSIEKQVSIQVPRRTYLKMSGDIAKHDLLRLIGVAEELRNALQAAGIKVDQEDALLALDDFYERFHTDILNYHGSTLVEFLNDIRWGIQDYLTPEYRRSYTPEGGTPPMYRYDYPTGVRGKFARQRYWDLMNDVRAGPYFPRFVAHRSLKMRY
jgi:hypothetical protein